MTAEISIHAPRAGSDYLVQWIGFEIRDFNPRSPCGERLPIPAIIIAGVTISIHAPRAGSDVLLLLRGL